MRHPMFQFLADHQTFDATEAQKLQETLAWLAATDRPVNRMDFSPGHATASGVVVCGKTGRVALVNHQFLKRWLQPGGHVESDDPSIAAAAAREVREELGIAVEASLARFIDIDVHEIPAGPKGPAHLHFDARFLFVVQGEEICPAEGEAHARWFPIDEALAITSEESLTRLLLKARLALKK